MSTATALNILWSIVAAETVLLAVVGAVLIGLAWQDRRVLPWSP